MVLHSVPTLNLQIHTLRLVPGDDLKTELEKFAQTYAVEAGFIITCVGSLTDAVIRPANQDQGKSYRGYFEIVSLGGTLSINGCHVHISFSDSNGNTTGGHLLEGSLVYTTVELVIGVLPDVVYNRVLDPGSGYKELASYPKKP